MTYTTKDGKKKNTYVLGGKRQREMCERGWRICLADSYHETRQQMYDRLSKYYSDVRIYEETTRIAGYHTLFAMCRG